jgi:hypothetical protein
MKPLVKLLSFIVLVSLFATSARAQLHRPPGPRAIEPQYHTQPGTQELPLRYGPPAGPSPSARLAYWNDVALRAIAVDHTPPFTAGTPFAAEQLGPTRTSRVLAIVHIAIYDALNAILKRYPGYSGPLPAFADSSLDAAIAQSAHDTLAALYPRQASRLDSLLTADLARLPPARARLNGIDIGRRSAAAILALRANDGIYYEESVVGEDYFPEDGPGRWRPDPVSQIRIALGAYWGRMTPFVLQSPTQFRAPPPPALDSEAYALTFAEVKQLGGDGIKTPTGRTADQTVAGIYWAYDGTPWIGTPPRLYNQIAVQLALGRSRDVLELARTLALVNVAIADTTMSVWDTKYYYDFWRPVTAIRQADDDDNPATLADPDWTPLGAPASNLVGPNFTPPFPAYTSGHAGLGGAMFQILRRLYGDGIAFTFVSDEYNGVTRDNRGRVRPRLPRSFSSLSQAEEENGQSRIYLGIHWQFDKTSGREQGQRVADYIYEHGLVRPNN